MKLIRRGLVLASALVAVSTYAAAAQALSQEAKVYTNVDQMPQLTSGGGLPALVAAIEQRVVYPPQALRERFEGQVVVAVLVAADGSVQNIAIAKSLRSDCDRAVLRVVERLPRLVPGRQAGERVKVQLRLPITLKLPTPAR